MRAKISSCPQSWGTAWRSLFPWKPYFSLVYNGFWLPAEWLMEKERSLHREDIWNVTKMSGFSHIRVDPPPPSLSRPPLVSNRNFTLGQEVHAVERKPANNELFQTSKENRLSKLQRLWSNSLWSTISIPVYIIWLLATRYKAERIMFSVDVMRKCKLISGSYIKRYFWQYIQSCDITATVNPW